MRGIKNKLGSRRGASITFALLLFLVCAVVSSVVVVAASTASGRMSKMAEMDQRYYAVTSAAELLCDDIDGKRVTVVYAATDDTGEKQATATRVEDMKKLNAGKPEIVGNDASSITNRAAIVADAAEKLFAARNGSTVDLEPPAWKLTSPDMAALECKIVETIQKDGKLVFEISNSAGEDANAQIYILQTVFSANIKDVGMDSGTNAKKAEITWKLETIKKVRGYQKPASTEPVGGGTP